jgi:Holliday junction DNA helicase RuvA
VIGYLRGVVLHQPQLGANAAIIDVNGVGYEVFMASAQPSGVGTEVEIFVHTVVRPDALILYGFDSLAERRLFETLLATPGVGPSTALAALRTLGSDVLAKAIEDGDVKKVGTIPGVGPKTASRIVLELKGKLIMPEREGAAPTSSSGDIDEVLKSWGYTSAEIRDALKNVSLPDDDAQALKMALGLLRRS